MDLILGGFADRAIGNLEPAEFDAFESLLSENDHDLYQWIAGRGSIPEQYQAIIGRIKEHHRIE